MPTITKPRRSKLPERCFAVTEKHVQQAVVEFLQHDGWRAIRTEHAIERTLKGDFKRRVGEVGMPDYGFMRYIPVQSNLWIEFKRPGGKLSPEQMIWHQMERLRGGTVLVVDDIDSFRDWYCTRSGLYRSRTF